MTGKAPRKWPSGRTEQDLRRRRHARPWPFLAVLLLAATAWLVTASPAEAQPFGTWLTLTGHPTHGYVRVPHSAALKEVMVKAINGCSLNDRHWIFFAATTNIFFRLQVTDTLGGAQKIYFNYAGPPAPAVTDTSAFATCP